MAWLAAGSRSASLRGQPRKERKIQPTSSATRGTAAAHAVDTARCPGTDRRPPNWGIPPLAVTAGF